jgi:hypothetical protein
MIFGNKHIAEGLCMVTVLLFFSITAFAQSKRDFDFRKHGRAKPAIGEVIQTQQGYNMLAWMGTNAAIGGVAFDAYPPPSEIVGLEYPVGPYDIEHLYGVGIWFGTLVDTGRRGPPVRIHAVTSGYDWNPSSSGPRYEMYGHRTASDTFFRTSVNEQNKPNKRHFDDDGDGWNDEDELDGIDNDSDWIATRDDLGKDGLRDEQEVGCKGGYDPVKNPDPAYDNYDPSSVDSCKEGFPFKNDVVRYTQNNNLLDAGEPHIDEDYGAVSESDVYVSYSDTLPFPVNITNHNPLGIKVLQKSFAWGTQLKYPILPLEYYIINISRNTFDSVYIAFFVDPLVGPLTVPTIGLNKFCAYIPELRTAYVHNPVDKPSTPLGVTVLSAPKSLDSLKYTFEWYDFGTGPSTDREKYQLMSSGIIKPDQPLSQLGDTQFLFGFGPLQSVQPGDTMKIVVALVSGEAVEQGFNNLKKNATRALELFYHDYQLPVVPPSPPLRIRKENERVFLDWQWRPGDSGIDPLESWDDSNKFVDVLPDTHWRRRNPPAGHSRGGRIFEGFKLWRSESPNYNPASFALMKQYDVDDNLPFEYGTGLQFTFVDSNLVRGRRYWYAVTSFSIPGASIVQIPNPGGPVIYDTLVTDAQESDIQPNATLVQLPFAPSTQVGEVKVVPNPYRTDADYTFEGGGWEGLSRLWTENQRVIWFIHLPPKCTIRIFSLSGDLVATLHHDDDLRTTPDRPVGQEEWNLLSESGRAIASGIYMFTVDSDFGRQIGKFVVIR